RKENAISCQFTDTFLSSLFKNFRLNRPFYCIDLLGNRQGFFHKIIERSEEILTFLDILFNPLEHNGEHHYS
ncbi:hypothetical protein, partial [Streptococcus gordonii]|uniref:hypothetical protein n=1 Tax=Streptococcus gordonii TaxID=1302 RepID=UPI001D07B0EE